MLVVATLVCTTVNSCLLPAAIHVLCDYLWLIITSCRIYRFQPIRGVVMIKHLAKLKASTPVLHDPIGQAND